MDLNRLYKLERKYGRYAIEDLMLYIVFANAIVFIIDFLMPATNLINKLMLYPDRVLKGDVWRLLTFLFVPPSDSIIWIVFALYFYYLVGTSLEDQWGSFRFNIYYLIGVLASIAAAFLAYATMPVFYGAYLPVAITPEHLNLSLFLAFAHLFPNFEVVIFFILPVKVKYLAWINWAFIIYSLIFNPLPIKFAAVASIVNYLIFFGSDIIKNIKLKRQVYKNRRRFRQAFKK